jgi:signal transduction histidine kinase
MRELERSLEALHRLGLYLDADEAAAARARRTVRLNTRVYPRYRAIGMQLLIAAVVIHNLAVFGRAGGVGLGVFVLATELYAVLSWWALRAWYTRFGAVRGWDLADLFFAADLVLWGWAIQVTGGPESLIFFLPLLRVADHRAADKAMAFAHLGPLTYLAVVLAAAPGGVVWSVELAKLMLLYLAGVYVAWTGRPAQRAWEEREAALTAAAAIFGRLRERTERLDRAQRQRSSLVGQLGQELRGALVRIVGFSRYLVREAPVGDAALDFVRRIHEEGAAALEQVDRALDPDREPEPEAVSVSALLRRTAEREAERAAGEPAALIIPEDDATLDVDAERLTTLLGHLLAAGRHLNGGPATAELEVASETGSPERVVVRVDHGVEPDTLFDAFSPELGEDQSERLVRLELSMARTLARGLGYDLVAEPAGPGTALTLLLR